MKKLKYINKSEIEFCEKLDDGYTLLRITSKDSTRFLLTKYIFLRSNYYLYRIF